MGAYGGRIFSKFPILSEEDIFAGAKKEICSPTGLFAQT
jgi:hypothetical protein